MRHARQISQFALILAAGLAVSPAGAQTANTTVANVNVLNLLAPFLSLNATTVGQRTLTDNLQQAISVNNDASPTLRTLAISDKNILGSYSNTVTGLPGFYGVAGNLGGGLPTQTISTGLTPVTIPGSQPNGGLGAVLGPIYVTGVNASTTAGSGPLANTATLLVKAYSFTSSDLGVAKNYFANGAASNPSTRPPGYVATPAVAPPGLTLPTFNGLPNTTNSVYDIAYGVNNTQPGQNVYGSSRPAQVAPTQINLFDPTALNGITTNPAFPSGHTNYAFTDSILIGMLVPQQYQSMLSRAAEYGDSRIVLGVHYPLDIIGSRSFAAYDLAQAFTNPRYINNAATTGTAINLASLFTAAQPELTGYLSSNCGASVTVCAASSANANSLSASAANAATYAARLNYGLSTLTYTQAPREQAPAGGPDASILLATVYGGSTSAAKTLAPNGGILGNLATGTINQIIVNTEGQALAAFYGTALSYWSRINLYAADGYFAGVTGALTFAPGDKLTTNVSVSSGGSLGGAGTIYGNLTYQGGSTLTATPGATLTVHNGAVALQSGSSVALNGTFLPGSYSLVQTDAGQKISLGSVSVTGGSFLNYELASLAIVGDPTLTVTLTSHLMGIAQTQNQRAVAAGIDASANSAAFAGNSAGQSLYANLIASNANASTLDLLGGAGLAEANEAALEAGASFAATIAEQALFGLADAAGAGDINGVSHFVNQPTDGLPSVKGALPRQRDWRVWGEFLGAGSNISSSSNNGSPSASNASYGGVAGLDYRIQPNWLVGVALGGSSSNFSLNSLATSGNVDGFQAGLYTAYALYQGYYAELSGSFGSYHNGTTRYAGLATVPQENLTGSFASYEERVRLEFGRAVNFHGYNVTPFVAGEFVGLQSNSFTELNNGGGANTLALNVSSKTTVSAPIFVGFKWNGSAALFSGWTVTPNVTVAWVHEFEQNRELTAALIPLPGSGFTVYGPRPASDLAQVKAGVQVAGFAGVNFFAEFNGLFSGSQNYYGGQGGLRYNF